MSLYPPGLPWLDKAQALDDWAARTGRFVGMDLTDPPVDYLALATSMAVDATRVDHTVDVGDAVKSALASGRPHVLELPITA